MFATRERPNAPAPRPLVPKLAITTRSSPPPRIPNQSTLSPTTRKPLSVISSSAPSRYSPASGRSTPNKAFIGSDITPRSASRLSRVDNANSTPTGTIRRTNGTVQSPSTLGHIRPTVARGVSSRSGLSERDVAIAGLNGVVPRMSPRLVRPQLESAAEIKGSSFLHASDAPAPKIAERPLPKKIGSFIYANGEEEGCRDEGNSNVTVDQIKSASTLHPGVNEQASMEDEGDILSTQLKPTARDSEFLQYSSTTLVAQASSTKVENQLHCNVASPPVTRSQTPKPMPTPPPQPQMSRRLSGVGTSSEPVSHHNRTGSSSSASSAVFTKLSAVDTNFTYPGMRVKRSSLTFSFPTPPISPGARSKRSSLNLVLPPAAPTSPTITQASSSNPKQATDLPSSPSQQQQAQQTTLEVAASARHERKLLDLEISNSSLLAINRTLEREVSKQKAELRRLRRATSDRTSWLSDAATELSEEGASLLSGGGAEDLEMADKFGYDENDSSRRSSSRRLSGKVLDLDFGKHKELLIDSQKMNLSLQRCIGITDQLIKDADKALKYRVHVDTSLPDDQDETEKRLLYSGVQQSQDDETEADTFFKTWGALSTRSISSPPHHDIRSLTFGPPHGDPEDKDSGIDVEYTDHGTQLLSYDHTAEGPKPINDTVGGWRKEEDSRLIGTP